MAGAVDFDAEYRIYDGKTRLNAEELTRRFLSLHFRLNALEEKGAGWDELQAAGLTVALQRINAVITPLILATEAQVAAIEAALNAVEAQVALILAGGVPASSVAETADRVFVTPGQRAAIDALVDAVDALEDAVLYKSALATKAQAEAGTDVQAWMSPQRVAQAIAKLTPPPAVKSLFTTALAVAITSAEATKCIVCAPASAGTVTLDASAKTDGFFCYIKNPGPSVVTIAAAGAMVDGTAGVRTFPGESVLLRCDGTNFHTAGLHSGRRLLLRSAKVAAAVATVEFDLFGDFPDFSAVELEYENVGSSYSPANFMLQVRKGAAYITDPGQYAATDASGNYVENYDGVYGVPLYHSGVNGRCFGRATLLGPSQTLVPTSFFHMATTTPNGQGRPIQGFQPTLARVQGLRVIPSKGTITVDSVFRLYGTRA